jgi:hypothetical protein
MAEPQTKQRIMETVQALPEDATVEDAMERLYLLAKIERGVERADSGTTITHEAARQRLSK